MTKELTELVAETRRRAKALRGPNNTARAIDVPVGVGAIALYHLDPGSTSFEITRPGKIGLNNNVAVLVDELCAVVCVNGCESIREVPARCFRSGLFIAYEYRFHSWGWLR